MSNKLQLKIKVSLYPAEIKMSNMDHESMTDEGSLDKQIMEQVQKDVNRPSPPI